MRLRDEQVRALLSAAGETGDVEIDCDEFLSLMPQYAEVRAEGRAVPQGIFERAAAHERLCSSCREELAALVEIVKPRE